VAAAVLGLGSLLLRTQAAASPALAGVSPSSSSTIAASPGTSGSADALTADERALLARIPLDFQAYCRRSTIPDGSAGGVASIRCDLPADSVGYGADTVWYDTFASRGEMILAVKAIAGRESLPAGDCAGDATRALGRWSLGTTFTGQLACYPKGGDAWLLWSYEGDQILARAVRREGDHDVLRAWWRDRAAGWLR
jgi:hypothetical protein